MKRKGISSITYHDDLMRDLKNPTTAIGYLNLAMEDSDRRVFLLALRDVAESWGGMTTISKISKIPRITLYKILSKKGNPEIQTLDAILHALGFRLSVMPLKPRKLRRAA
ncbi:MAG: hypothetical protein A3A86_01895 [Elusimicrobia bacterium RIFCSPLOWO2_01_FULL_60_11]|nr:MAG: hypothetical protein A3A86_01895 [Elusimicrobia bacterium RIFCSPLOWO2_01_FULL_60_11]